MSTMRIHRWSPILLMFVAHMASAQQDPMYTMYMWNTLAVNPGYAGSADLFTVTGLAEHATAHRAYAAAHGKPGRGPQCGA